MKEQYNAIEARMNKTIDSLRYEYSSIRAGRANPGVLDRLTVDYYGTPTPINAVAAISVSEARTLVIQPWDKALLKAVEKAIQASDIGINPNNDGNVVRITFPPLTEERRRDICKGIHKTAEEAKIAVRSIRRDANEKFKAMKKAGEITEDNLKESEKKTQDITDKFCKEIDKIAAAKEKEILEV